MIEIVLLMLLFAALMVLLNMLIRAEGDHDEEVEDQ